MSIRSLGHGSFLGLVVVLTVLTLSAHARLRIERIAIATGSIHSVSDDRNATAKSLRKAAKDFVDLVDKGASIYKYYEDVADAIRRGEDPPDPPPTYKAYVAAVKSACKSMTTAAAAVSSKHIKLNTKGVGDVTSPEPTERRQVIDHLVWAIEMAMNDWVQQKGNVEDLEANIDHLKFMGKVIRQNMELVIDKLKALPKWELLWFDLDVLEKTVNRTRREVKTHTNVSNKNLSESATELLNASHYTEAFVLQAEFDTLVSQRNKLEGDYSSLFDADRSLTQLRQKITDSELTIERQKGDVADREIELENIKESIQENLDRKSEFDRHYDNANRRFKTLRNNRNNVCPRGFSWSNCKHEDKKQAHRNKEREAKDQRDDALNGMNSNEKQYGRLVVNEKVADDALKKAKDTLESEVNALHDLKDRYVKDSDAIVVLTVRYMRDRSDLDLLFRGNSQDRMRLSAAMRRLR